MNKTMTMSGEQWMQVAKKYGIGREELTLATSQRSQKFWEYMSIDNQQVLTDYLVGAEPSDRLDVTVESGIKINRSFALMQYHENRMGLRMHPSTVVRRLF